MSEDSNPDDLKIDLKEPAFAALLAWLIPGAGHFYQRRYRKGALFMICILGTFFFGMILGHGHVVYASWRPNDYRWQAVPQMGVGIAAFPAVVQNFAVRGGNDPFLITAKRYPEGHFKEFEVIPPKELKNYEGDYLADGFMAPPAGNIYLNQKDVLAMWTSESQHGFEIGTLYTIVAGLLNILAIYDAFAGPVLPMEEEKEESPDPDGDEASSGGGDGKSSKAKKNSKTKNRNGN